MGMRSVFNRLSLMAVGISSPRASKRTCEVSLPSSRSVRSMNNGGNFMVVRRYERSILRIRQSRIAVPKPAAYDGCKVKHFPRINVGRQPQIAPKRKGFHHPGRGMNHRRDIFHSLTARGLKMQNTHRSSVRDMLHIRPMMALPVRYRPDAGIGKSGRHDAEGGNRTDKGRMGATKIPLFHITREGKGG